MAYNTGNALGSTDARDLYDNATNLDNAVNGSAARWTDRLGVSRPSWAGMSHYNDIGTYAGGLLITGYNEIFLYDGEYYRAAASTALPYTTTGSWSDDGVDFVPIGDASLRSDLALLADTTIGPYRNAVNCNRYTNLKSALVDSDTLGRVIVVTDNQNITADIAVIGRQLVVEYGGLITIASGKTLTINGAFSCGDYQCFAGDGAVVFGAGSVLSVRPEWWGAVGDGVADDTSAMGKAILSHDTVLLAPTTYMVDQITLTEGKYLKTANQSSTLKQSTGTGADVRLINITGGNVKIGDISLKGNIATDSGEQHHAIFIRSSAAAIYGVEIGNVYAENIRGDVVYIGGYTATPTSAIKIGRIYGKNIYRNTVAITQGYNIEIASIDGEQIGIMPFDIEPEPSYGNVSDVRVGYIKGKQIALSASPGTICQGVDIIHLDLSNDYDTGSVPAYSGIYAPAPQALTLRNCRDIHIGLFKASTYTDHAVRYIYNAGESYGANITFDIIDWTDCTSTEATFAALAVMPQVNTFTINGGRVSQSGTDKRFFFGGVTSVVEFTNIDFTGSPSMRLLYICGPGSILDRIKFTSNSTLPALQYFSKATIRNSTISVPYFASFSNKMIIENSTVTASSTLFNATYDDHIITNSTINSVYRSSGPYKASYLGATMLGAYYLWVDAAGKLRIKSTAPTTDLDGTIVGTQS